MAGWRKVSKHALFGLVLSTNAGKAGWEDFVAQECNIGLNLIAVDANFRPAPEPGSLVLSLLALAACLLFAEKRTKRRNCETHEDVEGDLIRNVPQPLPNGCVG